jgi:hypothetical protein
VANDSDDDLAERSTAPKTAEEWRYIWRGATRGNRAGPVIDPIHSVATNWKAVAAVIAAILALNMTELRAAVAMLLGTNGGGGQ